ncbi:MAG: methyltransferase domain-containing protein [Mariniblastus sp.]|nr:methyltransferase domain-containing protein [Mariniblastus sp.]
MLAQQQFLGKIRILSRDLWRTGLQARDVNLRWATALFLGWRRYALLAPSQSARGWPVGPAVARANRLGVAITQTMESNQADLPMKRTTILLSRLIFCCSIAGLGCCLPAIAQQQEPETIERASLGNTKNVHRAGNLFFAGQFGAEDIDSITAAQVGRVITLRTEGEIDWDEAAAIRAAGLSFIEVPFRSPDSLTDGVFDQIRELLSDRSQTTLFHCGSANRVGGVWLPYRVLDEGVPLEQALNEAREIGLRTEFIESKAIDYIERQQAASEMAGEQSVKPGINQGFKDPDLDVDKMVERFELESREVYVARHEVIEACAIKPGSKVADVGSGTGLFTRLFAKSVGPSGWVYAVDIAPRLVEHVVKQSAAQGLENITGVVCAENSIGLPANSVDLVFVCDTYHHFEFPKSTLASISRALRPGGRLIVIDFERIEGQTRQWLLDHVRAGKATFRAEIQDAGFSLVDEKSLDDFQENYFLVFRKND